MKKLLTLTIVAMITSLSFAQKIQDKDLPTAVKSAFEKLYPNIKKVKWDKEEENYEAGFEIQDKDYSLLLDNQGNVVEIEIEVDIQSLPSGAKEYISKNFPKQKIKEASKITDNKGVVIYEVELKSGDVFFDKNGNFIKKD